MNWCFTWNYFTPEDVEPLKLRLAEGCKFACFENEIGESGTPHLQGCLQLKKKQRMNGVKNLIGCPHVHVEMMRGTIAEAAAYCKKDYANRVEGCVYWETGNMVFRASKKDHLKDAIDQFETLDDLRDAEPDLYCRFRQGLRDIYDARIEQSEKRVPEVYWFWGPTGSGKSREAWRLALESGSFWVAPLSLDWFDGYIGQDVVLFDDFRKPKK